MSLRLCGQTDVMFPGRLELLHLLCFPEQLYSTLANKGKTKSCHIHYSVMVLEVLSTLQVSIAEASSLTDGVEKCFGCDSFHTKSSVLADWKELLASSL